MEYYMTSKEASEKWGISPRRIQTLCSEGRLSGVVKAGRMWLIPCDTEKPEDARVTSGLYRDWRKFTPTPVKRRIV